MPTAGSHASRPLFVLFVLAAMTFGTCSPPATEAPRGVVLMIGDGMGYPQIAFARKLLLQHGGRWAFEAFPVTGIVSTFSASNATTDSGAAATAMAAGIKTTNWQLGMTFEGETVPSLTELALAEGWRVGYVTTTTLTHATPAAFYTHVANRYADTERIATDLIGHGATVALGGGSGKFLPADAGGEREDGRNLLEEAATQGWTVWDSSADLDSVLPERLLGVFSDSHLPFRLDDLRVEETARAPSLSRLTEIALGMLAGVDDRPFLLLVEGGRIDHACHAFDAAGSAYELADFSDAVATVATFQRQNPSTLVIVTADHATGGLGIGDAVDWDELRRQKATIEWMGNQIRQEGAGLEMLAEMTGYDDITEAELATVRDDPVEYDGWRNLGRLLGRRNGLSWLDSLTQDTKGHTGEDVPLYAIGPGAGRFQGVLDNTEIAIRVREVAGLSGTLAAAED